ncbi:hypothetical protein FKM82_004394 [Ascaphus truei]
MLSSDGLRWKEKRRPGSPTFSARIAISGLFSKRWSAMLWFQGKNRLPEPVYVAPTSSRDPPPPPGSLSTSPTVLALGWLAATLSMLGITLTAALSGGGKVTAGRVRLPRVRSWHSPWYTEPQTSRTPWWGSSSRIWLWLGVSARG